MINLLFSFAGRIGRGKFWLGFLFQILLMIVAIVIASVMVPWDQVMSIGADGQPATDAAGNPVMNWSAMGPALWIVGAAYVLVVWWSLAIAAKRCHDRGKSAWWLLIFAPSMLATLASYWFLFQSGGDMGAVAADGTYMILQLVAGVTGMIAFIWWLVDLGILEGEEGTNRWGPNPVPSSD